MCLVCLVLGSDARKAVDAASAEAVAGAFEGEHVGVVDDAVDHGCCDCLVSEHASPAIRSWHMFRLSDPGWCLGCLRSGVSADL